MDQDGVASFLKLLDEVLNDETHGRTESILHPLTLVAQETSHWAAETIERDYPPVQINAETFRRLLEANDLEHRISALIILTRAVEYHSRERESMKKDLESSGLVQMVVDISLGASYSHQLQLAAQNTGNTLIHFLGLFDTDLV
jgi:phosphoribosyl-AMP cyclohydrolase